MAKAKCPKCNTAFDVDEQTLDKMRLTTCPNCSSSFQLPVESSQGTSQGATQSGSGDEFDDFFEVGEQEQTDIKQKSTPKSDGAQADFKANAAEFMEDAAQENVEQEQPPSQDQVATDDEVFGGLEGFEEFLSVDDKESEQKKPDAPQQKPPEPPKPEPPAAKGGEAPKKDLLDDAFEELFADSPEAKKEEPKAPAQKPPESTPPKAEAPKPAAPKSPLKPAEETSKPRPAPEPSGETSIPDSGKKVDTVSDEAFEALFHDIKGPKSQAPSDEEISSGLGPETQKKKRSVLKLVLFVLLPVLVVGALTYFMVFTKDGLFGISYYSYFIEGYRKPSYEVMEVLKKKFEGVKQKLNNDYYPDYLSSLKDVREIISKDTRFIPAHAYGVYALLFASGDPLNQSTKKEIEGFLEASEKLDPGLNEGIIARAFYDFRSGNLAQAEKALNRLHKSGVKDALSYEILGNIYFSRGDYIEAKSNFEKSIELNPENLRVRHSLSMALYSEGAVDEALEILKTLKSEKNHLISAIDLNYIQWQNFNKAEETKSSFRELFDKHAKELSDFNFARLSSYLGDIYFKEEKLDEALTVLSKGLKRESFNPGIAYRLGIIHLEKNEPDEAVNFLKKAVNISPREVDYHVQYSQALRKNGQMDQALEEADKAIAIDADSVDALIEKGFAENELGKYAEALSSFSRVLTLEPRQLDALISSAEIKLLQKEYREAKEYFLKALGINRNIARAHSGLGAAYMGMGNRKKALMEFERAERLSPNNAEIIINIGKSLLSMGKYNEAKKNFQRVISLDDKYIGAYVGLGDIHYAKKNYSDALRVYRKGLELKPKNVDLKVKIAKCDIELKQFKPALKELRQASKMLVDYFPVHLHLGIVYRNLGNMDDALRELEKSTHIRPDSADAHYEYGLTLMRNAQVSVGLPHVFKAIEIDPKHIKTLQTLVDFYYETNNIEKAVEFSKKILSVDPKRWKSRLKLAQCYRKMGKDKLSYNTYLKVIKQHSDSPNAYIGAGKILEDNSQFARALKFYKLAAQKAPKNPTVHYHLGFAYKYLENKPMALKSFRKYLELAPSSPESEIIKEEIFYLTKKR